MNKLALAAVLAVSSLSVVAGAWADEYVRGYTRSNGTYVAPHYRTDPNSTRNDNYSTRGNTNPYTGEPGHKPRDEDSSFGSGSLYTPRSGDSRSKDDDR